MARRLKVLLSAYACEPDKGSEPEVGWQWALQMARFHDVTVLTRANNRAVIEAKLTQFGGSQPLPEFVYHEETPFLQRFKQSLSSLKLYYVLWQRSAREAVAQLHAERKFDLMHHVTFASFRYPTAIWGHGVPTVWGPVGGIESVPWRLLPWRHPAALFAETKRNVHNLLQAGPLQALPKRARASTIILASTPEMLAAFAAHGFLASIMPAIGLNTQSPEVAKPPARGPLRLLYVGNIITLKGIDFALRALQQSATTATLTLIGSGAFTGPAKKMAQQLGLTDQVQFLGKLPRPEVLQRYREFDVFIFPSLHDTGGYAVIEAMLNGLPVICLNCGGPAVAVGEGCGIKVPLGSREAVYAGLAAAIQRYDQDRELSHREGAVARQRILEHYDWERKGERMNEVYQKATEPERKKAAHIYTGISKSTHIIHRLVSFRGLAMIVAMLLVVGFGGFLSLNYLKRQAAGVVEDTLPRLALAGQANAYLADANRTITYIFTDQPEERAQLRHEIKELSDRTRGFLQKYGERMNGAAADRKLYETLIEERRRYIQLRGEVLELAAAGRRDEAIKKYTEALLPAHNRVKSYADQLFESDIQQGEIRSRDIMAACTFTQISVALMGVVVFSLGLFFGLFR